MKRQAAAKLVWAKHRSAAEEEVRAQRTVHDKLNVYSFIISFVNAFECVCV